MSLADCLKKAGKAVSATDRAALEDAFNEHQGKGLSEYEAGVAALTDFHKGLFDEVNDLRTRARLRPVEYQAPPTKPYSNLPPDIQTNLRRFRESEAAKVG